METVGFWTVLDDLGATKITVSCTQILLKMYPKKRYFTQTWPMEKQNSTHRHTHVEVSWNGGTPEPSILRFSMTKHPQLGVPPFMQIPIYHSQPV